MVQARFNSFGAKHTPLLRDLQSEIRAMNGALADEIAKEVMLPS